MAFSRRARSASRSRMSASGSPISTPSTLPRAVPLPKLSIVSTASRRARRSKAALLMSIDLACRSDRPRICNTGFADSGTFISDRIWRISVIRLIRKLISAGASDCGNTTCSGHAAVIINSSLPKIFSFSSSVRYGMNGCSRRRDASSTVAAVARVSPASPSSCGLINSTYQSQ